MGTTAAEVDEPGKPILPQREVWLLVGALMVGMFLSILDVLVVITALPTIAGDLGGRSQLAWVITAYVLTSTAAGPLIGKLGDQYGRKRLYQLSITVFVAGSLLSGLSQNMIQLIVARAVQGIGASGLAVLPMAIVGDVVPLRKRAAYQGVMSVNIVVASLAGPLVGGLFVDHLSWRWAFFVNLPLGLIALAVSARRHVPFLRAARVVFDIPGSVLVLAATTCVLLAVTWGGNEYSWTSPVIIGLLLAVPVLVALLVVRERRAEEPVLPPALFRNRRFVLLVSSSFLHAIAMNGAWVLMPIFLQVVTGATATGSGALLLPFMIADCLGMMISGRLAGRWNRYRVFALTGMIVATVGFGLYTTMGATTTRTTATLFMLVTGAGIGLMINIMIVLAQGSVSHRQLGVATAGIQFFRSLGQGVGTALAISVFNGVLADGLRSRFTAATRAALPADAVQGSPTAIRSLEPAVRHELVGAFARALHTGFFWLVPSAVVAVVIFACSKELHPSEVAAVQAEADAHAADIHAANAPVPPVLGAAAGDGTRLGAPKAVG